MTVADPPDGGDISGVRFVSVPFVLMLIASIALLGIIGVLAFITVPKENLNTLTTVVGSVTAAFLTIVGFYFGSNSSSKAKDQAISNLTPQSAAPPKSP